MERGQAGRREVVGARANEPGDQVAARHDTYQPRDSHSRPPGLIAFAWAFAWSVAGAEVLILSAMNLPTEAAIILMAMLLLTKALMRREN